MRRTHSCLSGSARPQAGCPQWLLGSRPWARRDPSPSFPPHPHPAWPGSFCRSPGALAAQAPPCPGAHPSPDRPGGASLVFPPGRGASCPATSLCSYPPVPCQCHPAPAPSFVIDRSLAPSTAGGPGVSSHRRQPSKWPDSIEPAGCCLMGLRRAYWLRARGSW